jgi:hypothetical protein
MQCRARSRPKSATANFHFMAVCFSFTHACVTAVVGLASSELPGKLGGYGNGVLYFAYSITAMCFSSGIVKHFGSRRALIASMWLFCFYVASYLLAIALPGVLQSPFVILGALVGGVGAAVAFTAQGSYFASCAGFVASEQSSSVRDTKTRFATIFAAIYLGIELVVKVLSSVVLYNDGSDVCLFVIFFAIAACGSSAMASVWDFPVRLQTAADAGVGEYGEHRDSRGGGSSSSSSGRPVVASSSLLWDAVSMWSDRKLLLMAPYQILFGFISSFELFFVNGVLVKGTVGTRSIGYLSAVISGAAALWQLPFSKATTAMGTPAPAMLLGAACFGAEAALFCAAPLESLGGWVPLVMVYLLHGTGRAAFEGINKAGNESDCCTIRTSQRVVWFDLVYRAGVLVTGGEAATARRADRACRAPCAVPPVRHPTHSPPPPHRV